MEPPVFQPLGMPTRQLDTPVVVGLGVRWLGRLALACFVYFGGTLALMHGLRPEYDPVVETVSQYAVGPYGYLMTSAFLALGPGVVALALGL